MSRKNLIKLAAALELCGEAECSECSTLVTCIIGQLGHEFLNEAALAILVKAIEEIENMENPFKEA